MSAPTHIQIRDAIKAKLDAITGIGKVHTYERYSQKQSDLVAFYKDVASGRLLGWHISRVASREAYIDIERWVRDHDWKIRGFMALDDADETQETFDTLIESICDAFRVDPSLGDLIFSTVIEEKNHQAGVQVEEVAPVLFGGVLCHSARLALTTRHLL